MINPHNNKGKLKIPNIAPFRITFNKFEDRINPRFSADGASSEAKPTRRIKKLVKMLLMGVDLGLSPLFRPNSKYEDSYTRKVETW